MLELIKSQQKILKDLGLYAGAIDGAWNLKSQLAMAGLQHSPSFTGLKARPDNSFFRPFEPLPKGMVWSEDNTVVYEEISTTPVEPIIPPVITTPVEPPAPEAATPVEPVTAVQDKPAEVNTNVKVDNPEVKV